MTGNKVLLEFEDHWPTKMGAWLPQEGKVIYRGKEIFRDLKDISWLGLLLYGITGRIFEEKSLKLLEGMWVLAISYPDPRLWANGIAALAGTVRSTGIQGVGTAIVACEGVQVGHRVNLWAIDFLLRTKKKLDGGANLKELVQAEMKKHRGIPGYGRPINPQKDERIGPVMELASSLGFADGDYVKLAFQIEQILIKGRWRKYMNITGLAAALGADQGLSSREYYYYVVPSFTAGILPCYIDALDKPEGSFFPLRCSRVQYEGPVLRRKWDNAQGSV
ncbi:MAG: hypothetical protein DRR19_00015 [Candidatus Parabeggiatoa sp. nov. 1]|nr:MAG: hypothetical protein DRR19_00015 [Gammaproteobacteria bacterium]